MSSSIAQAATMDLRDKRRRNLGRNEIVDSKEEVRLVWFSVNIDDSAESLRIQSILLELNPSALFYTDLNQCIDFIRSINDEQVFLILSDPFQPTSLLHIGNLHMVVAIFILSVDKQNLVKLMDEDDRIIDVFTDEDHLIESIRTKMRLIEKQTVAFNLFDDKQKSMRELSKESASFLWYQLLTHILKQMPHDEQSKQEMLDKIKDYYQTDKNMLKKIEKFRLTYTPEKAIEWYTDEGFLYKQLNRALRTKDIQLLHTFRFFIVDLCGAIERKNLRTKDNDALILYRGQQLSAEECYRIKNNVGNVIATNGFFSTSRDQNVALMFAGHSHKSSAIRSVLFEIEINSSLVAVEFADVADMSRFKDEQEVLFNLNALFKIVSVQFELILNVWKVCMVTTDDGPDKTGEYRLSVDKQLVEYSPIIYFGRLIACELGRQDLARQYFNLLLESLPSDHPDIASVYNNIGHIDYEISDINAALKNYTLAYEIRQRQLPPNSPHISSSLVNIGHIYRAKGNLDRALECYIAAANIDNQNYSGNHIRKANSNKKIALIYIGNSDFDNALIYLFHAMDMYKCLLPAQHHHISECLGSIGVVHENMGNLNVALDYYHQQLQMEEVCLPSDHIKIYQHANWIVNIYKKIGDTDTALMFCQKRLNTQKNTLGENHSDVARTLMMMASVLQQTDHNQAFEHYQQALSILKCTAIPNYQAISECLTAMGCFYSVCGMLNEALKAHLEAVDLNRHVLSNDHVDLAYSLRNLGASYRDMNNITEAKRYFNESLSIYQANYDPKHKSIQLVPTDLADLNEELP
jgi:tetratricopeptide (TPR) repeat protein